MKSKIYTISIIFFLMINLYLVSAFNFPSSPVEQNLGFIKPNSCIDLYQLCSNCTYINLTAIKYPNSTIQIVNYIMTKNNNNYIYNFCNTSLLGDYFYVTCGDKNGLTNCEDINFQVTQSGQENINTGQGLILLGSLIIIVLMSLLFFGLYLKSESLWSKATFGSLSIVNFLIAILFTMVLITQVLGGYESLVTGFTTFWFVIRILLMVALTAFLLFVFYLSFKLWQFKRGQI
jgi:hypothetical protein